MLFTSRRIGAVIIVVCFSPAFAQAADVYVAANGNDGNAGDKSTPLASICAGVAKSKDGDTVHVAEGIYALAESCVVTRRRISVLGGYKADFSARDPFVHGSRVSAGPSPKALLRAGAGVDELLVDGFIFDGGASLAYGTGVCADCLTGTYDARLHEPLVALDQAGRVTLKNMVMVNAPGGGVGGTVRSSLVIDGAAIVNARPFALSVAGACGYASPLCVEATIKNITAVWTWREAYDGAAPGGSAIVIGAGVSARVERSVVAYSDRLAIELKQRPSDLVAQALVMFDNRLGDVGAMHGAELKAAPIGTAGEANGVSGAGPHGRMERLALPWDIDYLNRFLARARTPFYGARLNPNRAFMLSPAQDAGLKPPPGSRFTYAMAVAGQTSPEPVAPSVAEEAKIDSTKTPDKRRPPKKKPRKGRGK